MKTQTVLLLCICAALAFFAQPAAAAERTYSLTVSGCWG